MIWNIILALLCLGLSSVLIKLKDPIASIVETLCGIVDVVLRPISKPLRKLWQLIKEGLLKLFSWTDCLPITRFADNHPIFGTPSGIRLFLICLVYLIVTLGIASSGEDLLDFLLQTNCPQSKQIDRVLHFCCLKAQAQFHN